MHQAALLIHPTSLVLSVCLFVGFFFYQKDLVPKDLIIKFSSFNALEKCLLSEFASFKKFRKI